MTQISEREACTKRSWYMGGGIGLLVAFLMLVFGMSGLLMAIVVGALVAVIAGYLLITLLCKDVPAEAPQDTTRSAAAASSAAAPTASDSVASATGTVPAGDAGIGAARKASGPVEPQGDKPNAADVNQPVADTAAVADDTSAPEPIAATGDETAQTPIADTAAMADDSVATPPKAAPKETPKETPKEAASEKQAVDAPATKPGGLPKEDVHSAAVAGIDETGDTAAAETGGAAAKAPKATVAADDAQTAPAEEKPSLLEAPRPEGADDLKRIGGIGPKMEQTLNDLGIYHFDQLAGLSDQEIAWVDSRLRFKGRIERDNWIGQAKALADASAGQS